MNALAQPVGLISPEEYLEGELHSEVRHEYVDGYVYAMAGASADHIRISRNILTFLDNALRDQRCEPLGNDMKVKIPPEFADAYYYPDVTVSCDSGDDAKYFRERPSIIFEVLSPETERTDRREKAIAYRQIPSVQVYVMVAQDEPLVTVLRRAATGWNTETLQGLAAVLRLPTIGIDIPLREIYRQTAIALPPT